MGANPTPISYQAVIDLWRTRAQLARLIDQKPGLVRYWHSSDNIPEPHFAAVEAAATRCGFEGVTYALLNSLTPGKNVRPVIKKRT